MNFIEYGDYNRFKYLLDGYTVQKDICMKFQDKSHI